MVRDFYKKLLLFFTAFSFLVFFSARNVGAISYSLSFPTSVTSTFWPTYPNQVQQIEAFLWRDSDFTTIKQLTNLSAKWTVNPDYINVVRTDSVYFDRCPQVRTDLPCIMFFAQIKTVNYGDTGVRLDIFQDGNELVWNANPLTVKNVSNPPTTIPGTYPPFPTFTPHSFLETNSFWPAKRL